jgi:hypothetical protein
LSEAGSPPKSTRGSTSPLEFGLDLVKVPARHRSNRRPFAFADGLRLPFQRLVLPNVHESRSAGRPRNSGLPLLHMVDASPSENRTAAGCGGIGCREMHPTMTDPFAKSARHPTDECFVPELFVTTREPHLSAKKVSRPLTPRGPVRRQ